MARTEGAVTELVRCLNDWVAIDIPLAPVQVESCGVAALPADFTGITHLIAAVHRDFIRQHRQGGFSRDFAVTAFDPTAYCRYTRYGEQRDAAPQSLAIQHRVRDYFAARTVQLARGRGSSPGAYPFTFDWLIALDPMAGFIFSFILNLQD